MAKSTTSVQPYPRIDNEKDKFHGFIDDSRLKPHIKKIKKEELKKIVVEAIQYANVKSGREILKIPDNALPEELSKAYKKAAKELFTYFVKYCGDPASSAHDCLNKHYSLIAKEQFRNRTIQKERMNAGWRYQYIAKDSASISERFENVSDIGTAEADFNVVISDNSSKQKITIYVSVKNRTNTLGGQDWPKAIRALEDIAKSDKNRFGPYLCVFGIAMDKGQRQIRLEGKTGNPYSFNTEIWLSDFFWPFFANFNYDEVIKIVLEVLIEKGTKSSLDLIIPSEIIEEFGAICMRYDLLNNQGNFNDAFRLADLFCGKLKL